MHEDFLSKNSQAMLREKYNDALCQMWSNSKGKVDQRMVDYVQTNTAVIVPMDNGTLVPVPKPSIKKDFCFGYSACGQGMSDDECNETISNVRNDLADYFKEENLKRFNSDYSRLSDADIGNLCLVRHYCSQNDANVLHSISTVAGSYGHTRTEHGTITAADTARYNAAIAMLRMKFSKKLDTYLKKYGTLKLNVFKYWADE